MRVTKRNGSSEDVKFDKVTRRIKAMCIGLERVDPAKVSLSVVQNMYDGIPTYQIDSLSSDTCIGMSWDEPEYETLAVRILSDNLRKAARPSFFSAMSTLHKDEFISGSSIEFIKKYKDELCNAIEPTRDHELNYFGLKTLEKSYLYRSKGVLVETPQFLWMRVAVGVHHTHGTLNDVLDAYDFLSKGYFTHATPTLFNACSNNPQCSSCYLMGIHEDSLNDIFRVLNQTAQVSKWAGGVGLHTHAVRSKGSQIRGTNGTSDGIIPMLRVFNNTARYVNQGGKRKGSVAIYLEPWHADTIDFLELRLNEGDPENRCRDIYTALWVPDLFMERVQANMHWSFFCPDTAKGLADVYGDEFKAMYEKYERDGLAVKTLPAQQVWTAMIKSQVETGTPYVVFKDTVNKHSNQKNLGTIKCSNLCVEIQQFTSSDEVAVCNLASIALPKYVNDNGTMKWSTLHDVTKFVVKSLNRVIDINFYPIKEAENSNRRHRPIGLGVQGLADVFHMMGIAFDSPEAKQVNHDIFERIYLAACEASTELAKEHGSYESFQGSPASEGKFQFDLYDDEYPNLTWKDKWDALRPEMQKGMRNSLLVAPMPTASTAQILGNNEAFEPYTTNVYLRRTLAGEFKVINKHLVRYLIDKGIWNKETRDTLVRDNGSVKSLDIPDGDKGRFKTIWELSMRNIIDLAADRQRFICQSQSMNLFVAEPTNAKVTSMLFHAWKMGLKTGMYYLRTKPKVQTQQFTLDASKYENCATCSA